VISDPPSNNLGFLFPSTPADIVTVSHVHGDHTNVASVQGAPMLIDGRNVTERQEIMAAGTNFVIVPGFHDVAGNTRNSIVTWSQGGIRFAQFGDYGQAALTEEQLNDLRGVDVAFIAASTPTTLPTRMKDLIDQLRPRIAILSHFRMPLGGFSGTLPFQDVIAPFTEIVYKPSNVILNRNRLPRSPQIWMMQPISNSVTVNSASYGAGVPVTPGSLASLFGSFTNASTMAAPSFPLPTALGNVEVMVGGVAAPLLYVSPTQINFQVSNQLVAPRQTLAEVRVNGVTVGRAQITTLSGAPGIFTVTDQEYQSISIDQPVRRGDAIIIWGTGFGQPSAPVQDGQPAPSNQLLSTTVQPIVTVGGVQAEVLFSGLAPGSVGGWQINVLIPANAPAGRNVPLVVTQGLRSNTFPIAISRRRNN
jgi:uncharacterized protein (TIGR03437 family)